MKKTPSAVDALQQAAKGLVFTSETDAKLEPFLWKEGGDPSAQRLVQLAGAKAGTPVEEMTLDAFFHAVPSEDKARFDRLAKVLKEQLSGVKVYKLGAEAEKQVYIVGKTQDGQWAGLETTVVET
jgi:histidine triad (HIT) family protein